MSEQTINQTVKEIRKLTAPIPDKKLRKSIIEYVRQLHEKLEAQEYNAFGFSMDDVRQKYLEMLVNDLDRDDLEAAQDSGDLTPETAKDYGLTMITEDECKEVLDHVLRKSDMSVGVSWDTIEWAIDECIDMPAKAKAKN